MDTIAGDIEYYKTNRQEFIHLYPGKHLVIKDMQVVGVYNTKTEANAEAVRLYESGSFIIEHPMLLKTSKYWCIFTLIPVSLHHLNFFPLHIHISNLHRDTTYADIHRLFASFGQISVGKLSFVMNKSTRIALGYTVVEISDEQAGRNAIDALQGCMLTGNQITLKQAG
jgi:hypothetical protein